MYELEKDPFESVEQMQLQFEEWNASYKMDQDEVDEWISIVHAMQIG